MTNNQETPQKSDEERKPDVILLRDSQTPDSYSHSKLSAYRKIVIAGVAGLLCYVGGCIHGKLDSTSLLIEMETDTVAKTSKTTVKIGKHGDDVQSTSSVSSPPVAVSPLPPAPRGFGMGGRVHSGTIVSFVRDLFLR